MKKVLDSLDGLSDALKPLYTKKEEDGKFYLNNQTIIDIVDKASNLDDMKAVTQKTTKDNQDLRAALLKQQELVSSQLKSGNNQSKEYDDLKSMVLKHQELINSQIKLKNPSQEDEIRKIKAENEELRKLKEGSKIPENLKEVLRKVEEDKQKALAENKKLKEKMKNDMVKSQVKNAISKNKGNATILEPYIMARIKTVDAPNGELEIKITNDSGEFVLNDSGTSKTVDEFVNDMKKDKQFAACFYSESIAGADIKKGNIHKSSESVIKPTNKGLSPSSSKSSNDETESERIARIENYKRSFGKDVMSS